MSNNFEDLLNEKPISNEFKLLVKEIFADLGLMRQNEFAALNAQELDAKWDNVPR